jgi:hypothetical protein
MTLTNTQRNEITAMLTRFTAAFASGKTISPEVVLAAKAAQALLDGAPAEWLEAVARSVADASSTKTLVLAAAHGLPQASIKPLV